MTFIGGMGGEKKVKQHISTTISLLNYGWLVTSWSLIDLFKRELLWITVYFFGCKEYNIEAVGLRTYCTGLGDRNQRDTDYGNYIINFQSIQTLGTACLRAWLNRQNIGEILEFWDRLIHIFLKMVDYMMQREIQISPEFPNLQSDGLPLFLEVFTFWKAKCIQIRFRHVMARTNQKRDN